VTFLPVSDYDMTVLDLKRGAEKAFYAKNRKFKEVLQPTVGV
jgi:hypothetical protein